METAASKFDAVHVEGGENSVQKRGVGAPVGNQNRLTHGLRSKRSGGFLLGKLPPGCAHLKRATDTMRRLLEAAVMGTRGAITLTDEATIQTAARAERHSLYCGRLLAEGGDSLKFEVRMKLSAEVVRGSESRDKAIRELKLDANSRSALFAAIRQGHSDADGGGGESVVVVGEFSGDGHGGDVGRVVEQMAGAMAGATRARRQRKEPGAEPGAGSGSDGGSGEGLTGGSRPGAVTVTGSTEAVPPVAVIPVEAIRVPTVATMTEAEKTRDFDRPDTSSATGPGSSPSATSPAAAGQQVEAGQAETIETATEGAGEAQQQAIDRQATRQQVTAATEQAGNVVDLQAETWAGWQAGGFEFDTAAEFEFDTAGLDLGGLDGAGLQVDREGEGREGTGEGEAMGTGGDHETGGGDHLQAYSGDDRRGEAMGEAMGDPVRADRPVEVHRVDLVGGLPVSGGFDWSLGGATGSAGKVAGGSAGRPGSNVKTSGGDGTGSNVTGSITSGNRPPKRKGQ